MSGIKRKRVDYQLQAPSIMILNQPLIVVNSVVPHNGVQYLAIHPEKLGSSAQSNNLYFIMPKDGNVAPQGLQNLYLLPNNNQQNNNLNYCLPLQSGNVELNKSNGDENAISIQEVKDISCNRLVKDEPEIFVKEEPEIFVKEEPEIFVEYKQEKDLLEIRKDVNYEVAKRKSINKAILKPSEEIVMKPYESLYTGSRLIECGYPECKIVLNSFHARKVHMDDHKYPANSTFKCSICNMIFSNATERNQHVISHSVADTYKCDACLKTFPYYTSYRQHLHNGICPPSLNMATCFTCGIKFFDIYDLQIHNDCVCVEQ